jgi:hypothetical protein
MNSSYIKACLTCWLRFSKQISIFATEVGKYNADLLFVDKGLLTEIEIKTSVSDFKEDFKKKKHIEYKHPANIWAPANFYFAVTPDIAKRVSAELAGTKYGLLVIYPAMKDGIFLDWNKRVAIAKKATILHNRQVMPAIKATIVHRLASEVCNFWIKNWAK